MKPQVHLVVESSMLGNRRASKLPQDKRPDLLSVMDYTLVDQFFLWPSVLQRGLSPENMLSLDHYRSYQPPNVAYQYFEPWRNVLQYARQTYTLNGETRHLIVSCTEQDDKSSMVRRRADQYTQATGDSHVECIEDDYVWISPACRGSDTGPLYDSPYSRLNQTQCIPLVIQYSVDFALQISYFLNLPVALIVLNSGRNGDYSEYWDLVRKFDVIFGWRTPDDNLAREVDRQPVLPVMLNMPSTNKHEHAEGIYKTGHNNLEPRNYAWRLLRSVDTHVAYLSSMLNFYDSDLDEMMIRNRELKTQLRLASAADMAMPWDAESGVASIDQYSARVVACEWILEPANKRRWQAWLPSICAAGYASDETPSHCVPCNAGKYCAGGVEPMRLCPAGTWCPQQTSGTPPASRTCACACVSSRMRCLNVRCRAASALPTNADRSTHSSLAPQNPARARAGAHRRAAQRRSQTATSACRAGSFRGANAGSQATRQHSSCPSWSCRV